ncbi:MAG: AAA family ATPase [Bacteroidia bacterium]|nr:AAA family ATPase [Bacteroidia bacterium]
MAHFLHHYKKEKVVFDNLLHPLVPDAALSVQCSAWSGEISKNVNVLVDEYGTGFQLKYRFNLEGGEFPTQEFRAENVGFGISYTLPIIVAILSAKPNSLLLIENPEAHLHPGAGPN